jgi:hypothetical protein
VIRTARIPVIALLAVMSVTCNGSPVTPTPPTPPTPPPGPNAAPIVTNLTAQGSRPNQPSNMADLNEAITLVATVTDTETAPANLTYEWTATIGTFEGTGSLVMWRAPTAVTDSPVTATLTLTVVESYMTTNPQGQVVTAQHRVSRTVDVRVHDSLQEISDLSARFLTRFSISSFTPEEVVAEFSDSCAGKQDELMDTADIRCEVTHDSYLIGTPTASVVFGGTCPSPNPPFLLPGDGCAQATVHWETTANPGVLSCPRQRGIVPGQKETAEGIDFLSVIYESGEWRLCTSNFQSTLPGGAQYKK